MLENFKHFSSMEILTAGSTDYTLEDIPENLHKNIIPTLKVLEALREWYGKPIFLNCTYRSIAHNARVGGSRNSLHLLFNAIDFTVSVKSDLMQMYEQLIKYDSKKTFEFLEAKSMGIGRYPTFLHLDTRGIFNMRASRWRG
ncbi:MAG: hypothetical protein IPL84_03885 [Chitinophagaceae bacterium]|nr:hypothetical protein [Chitinophagaceae bacterium]